MASSKADYHRNRMRWLASPLAQETDLSCVDRHYHLHAIRAEDVAAFDFIPHDSGEHWTQVPWICVCSVPPYSASPTAVAASGLMKPAFFSVTGQLSCQEVVFETVPGLNGQPSPSSNTHIAFWVEPRPDNIAIRDWGSFGGTLERLAARSTVSTDLSKLYALDEHGVTRIRPQGTETRSGMQLVRLGSGFSWFNADGDRLSIASRGQMPFDQCVHVLFQLKHVRHLGAGNQHFMEASLVYIALV
ncbi:hypothetical protein BDY19DRAFT_902281 [Irpex rosettiformis]|uniref:Uncharacterized protein n=1 Tax=Irpex rosettiformis TaxID=378272 RepID=A0ACB8UMH6_9APHY|nr:hypothetical protein BDY19DRAFT_902281 [Irpex rosettiformis]